MALISIVAAMDEKRGIGKDNKIPWHIKEDLIHLRDLTKNHVVIMGRKTYDSMAWYYDKSGREMPGKLYIIVTHDPSFKSNRSNVFSATSLEEALSKVKNEEEIFINGGGQIFKEAIEKGLVDRLYLTIVDGDYKCDAFFPDHSNFTKVVSEEDQDNGEYKFKYLIVER